MDRNMRRGHDAVFKARLVIARAKVTEDLPSGMVPMTFHFAESPTNALTSRALDSVAKIPEFKCRCSTHRKGERLVTGFMNFCGIMFRFSYHCLCSAVFRSAIT
jgi:predicted molibdopterin-dependent oxidoreductase YjgC